MEKGCWRGIGKMKNLTDNPEPVGNKDKVTSILGQDTVIKRSLKFIDHRWIHTPFLVFFACHFIHCNVYSQKSTSAESFLTGLYATYQSPTVPDFLGKSADTLFTPALLQLIREDQKIPQGNVGMLDYDPLCDCQDFEISDFRVITKLSKENDILAEIIFKNFGAEVRLDISLKNDGRQWKIADIHTKSVPTLFHALQTKKNRSIEGAQ
jgi:Protein of unknown function (DUF3828)